MRHTAALIIAAGLLGTAVHAGAAPSGLGGSLEGGGLPAALPGRPTPNDPNLRIYGEDNSIPTQDVREHVSKPRPTDPSELLRWLVANNWAAATKATVMLAATTDAAHHGTLRPVFGEDDTVQRWRVEAETAQAAYDVCTDDSFAYLYGEPSAGFCTGFFVRNDLVLTAAHCLERHRDAMAHVRVVLDYTAVDGVTPASLPVDRVLAVELLVDGGDFPAEPDAVDWALLSLKTGPVSSERVMNRCGPGNCDTDGDLFAVSHPLGMPQRVLTVGEKLAEAGSTVQTNLDAFAGGSGSPVLDSLSGDVVGMLISGLADFEVRGNCRTTGVSPHHPGQRGGERVLRIDKLPPALLTALQ